MEPADQFDAARARITKEYEGKLSSLDRCRDAHGVATAITAAWSDAETGRAARVYLGVGHVMVYLGLAPTEIFASAEEAFDRAQSDLRSAFPSDWAGDWSEVKDDSSQHEARRSSSLTVAPAGAYWYNAGVLVSLTVGAYVTADSACRVIEVGQKMVTDRVETKRSVPIFKAICPGDPVNLQTAAA